MLEHYAHPSLSFFFNFLQEDNPHICHGTKEIKTYIFSVLSTQSAKSRTIVSLRNMINTCGFGFLLTLWSSAHRGRLLQLHVKRDEGWLLLELFRAKEGCSRVRYCNCLALPEALAPDMATKAGFTC